MARITFLGATGTVTGSKFLVEHDGFKLLIDCGLFQGLKELRLRNWNPPPVATETIDAVALTHAHLDHTGYLPVLMKNGFEGKVHCTAATKDLCGIILPDSGHLQEEDARFANKKGYSKHRPALPLYTEDEARSSLRKLVAVPFGKPQPLHDSVAVTWHLAGHIPGAAFVEVRLAGKNGWKEKTILFSGDLGRPAQPIVPDPLPCPPCDVLVLESTYGNRDHPTDDPKDRLATIIREAVARGGSILIPAFAVGRTQQILYLLRELRAENRIPSDVPIWIDSPMAIEATRIVRAHPEAHDAEMRELERNGGDPLGVNGIHSAPLVEDSKALNSLRYPAIIISASGMCEGGRILHHLAYKLPDHRTTVLFVGYQGVGTRGRALQDGARAIKIHGQEIAVRARIVTLDGLSAHADRSEIVSWLAASEARPKHVHLVHGEPDARDALAETIRERFGYKVHTPQYLERAEL